MLPSRVLVVVIASTNRTMDVAARLEQTTSGILAGRESMISVPPQLPDDTPLPPPLPSSLIGELRGPSNTSIQEGVQRKKVSEYDVLEVCEWLRQHGHGRYVWDFMDGRIDGESLLLLGKDDLSVLCPSAPLGDMLKVFHDISKARREIAEAETTSLERVLADDPAFGRSSSSPLFEDSVRNARPKHRSSDRLIAGYDSDDTANDVTESVRTDGDRSSSNHTDPERAESHRFAPVDLSREVEASIADLPVHMEKHERVQRLLGRVKARHTEINGDEEVTDSSDVLRQYHSKQAELLGRDMYAESRVLHNAERPHLHRPDRDSPIERFFETTKINSHIAKKKFWKNQNSPYVREAAEVTEHADLHEIDDAPRASSKSAPLTPKSHQKRHPVDTVLNLQPVFQRWKRSVLPPRVTIKEFVDLILDGVVEDPELRLLVTREDVEELGRILRRQDGTINVSSFLDQYAGGGGDSGAASSAVSSAAEDEMYTEDDDEEEGEEDEIDYEDDGVEPDVGVPPGYSVHDYPHESPIASYYRRRDGAHKSVHRSIQQHMHFVNCTPERKSLALVTLMKLYKYFRTSGRKFAAVFPALAKCRWEHFVNRMNALEIPNVRRSHLEALAEQLCQGRSLEIDLTVVDEVLSSNVPPTRAGEKHLHTADEAMASESDTAKKSEKKKRRAVETVNSAIDQHHDKIRRALPASRSRSASAGSRPSRLRAASLQMGELRSRKKNGGASAAAKQRARARANHKVSRSIGAVCAENVVVKIRKHLKSQGQHRIEDVFAPYMSGVTALVEKDIELAEFEGKPVSNAGSRRLRSSHAIPRIEFREAIARLEVPKLTRPELDRVCQFFEDVDDPKYVNLRVFYEKFYNFDEEQLYKTAHDRHMHDKWEKWHKYKSETLQRKASMETPSAVDDDEQSPPLGPQDGSTGRPLQVKRSPTRTRTGDRGGHLDRSYRETLVMITLDKLKKHLDDRHGGLMEQFRKLDPTNSGSVSRETFMSCVNNLHIPSVTRADVKHLAFYFDGDRTGFIHYRLALPMLQWKRNEQDRRERELREAQDMLRREEERIEDEARQRRQRTTRLTKLFALKQARVELLNSIEKCPSLIRLRGVGDDDGVSASGRSSSMHTASTSGTAGAALPPASSGAVTDAKPVPIGPGLGVFALPEITDEHRATYMDVLTDKLLEFQRQSRLSLETMIQQAGDAENGGLLTRDELRKVLMALKVPGLTRPEVNALTSYLETGVHVERTRDTVGKKRMIPYKLGFVRLVDRRRATKRLERQALARDRREREQEEHRRREEELHAMEEERKRREAEERRWSDEVKRRADAMERQKQELEEKRLVLRQQERQRLAEEHKRASREAEQLRQRMDRERIRALEKELHDQEEREKRVQEETEALRREQESELRELERLAKEKEAELQRQREEEARREREIQDEMERMKKLHEEEMLKQQLKEEEDTANRLQRAMLAEQRKAEREQREKELREKMEAMRQREQEALEEKNRVEEQRRRDVEERFQRIEELERLKHEESQQRAEKEQQLRTELAGTVDTATSSPATSAVSAADTELEEARRILQASSLNVQGIPSSAASSAHSSPRDTFSQQSSPRLSDDAVEHTLERRAQQLAEKERALKSLELAEKERELARREADLRKKVLTVSTPTGSDRGAADDDNYNSSSDAGTPSTLQASTDSVISSIRRQSLADLTLKEKLAKQFTDLDRKGDGMIPRSHMRKVLLDLKLPNVSRVDIMRMATHLDSESKLKVDYKKFCSQVFGAGSPFGASSPST